MVNNITNYIRSLNFKYHGTLMDEGIDYFNAKGSFVDEHTVHIKGPNEDRALSANHIVIATGGRPSIP